MFLWKTILWPGPTVGGGSAEVWTSGLLPSPSAEKSLVQSATRRITGSPWEWSGHGHVPKSWDWEAIAASS